MPAPAEQPAMPVETHAEPQAAPAPVEKSGYFF
jgi:hypothetical protein